MQVLMKALKKYMIVAVPDFKSFLNLFYVCSAHLLQIIFCFCKAKHGQQTRTGLVVRVKANRLLVSANLHLGCTGKVRVGASGLRIILTRFI